MSIETAAPKRQAEHAAARLGRLSTFDRMYLSDERPAWPCHFGGLAVVEGGVLLDSSGRLRLDDIRDRLNRRLARVPALKRRLYYPGPLRGGPIWVDDARFAIDQHVRETAIHSPGGEAELLEAAARLYGGLLDRARPLWELWFMTGLSDGRVGVLLKLHHAVADGNAAVGVLGSLFDSEPDAADGGADPWTPKPIPGGWSLLADNLSGVIRTVIRRAGLLAHPMRIVGAARVFAMVTRRMVGQKGAPRTSLNQIVRAGRRVGFLGLDLAAMKEAAHAHEGTVNDVVLDLWSGGLRQLLASRGELVAGLELVTAQAVSTRSASDGAVDNQAGTVVMRLPTWEADVHGRLDLIVRTTRKAKASQRSAAIAGVLAGLSATPIARYFNLHQRAVNVIVTNVVGPPAPMYIMGAPILEILPIIQLVGNVGLTLCAFSYAGRVFLVVTADATGFPDLDVLMAGMERDWHALIASRIADPVPGAEPVSA
jgi:diacylglycerol O-acyltransferase